MAEKIGFISFSAFELHRANEFDAIKTRLYDAQRPARSFFEVHPAQPPWKSPGSIGIEHVMRRTPPELMPLMNEYHRYFLENSVQHELYLRWWRRHHDWDHNTELYIKNFDELRDYINGRYDEDFYVQKGRLLAIDKMIQEKKWQTEGMIEKVYVQKPMDKKSIEYARERTRITAEHRTREMLVSPNVGPPRWAQLLAMAQYGQKAQPPAPANHYNSTAIDQPKPPAITPPSLIKGSIA